MNLLLICETAIIEHIFTLVCKRLDFNLTIQKTSIVNDKFDLIIVDQTFIDDRFNTFKQLSRKLGAITSEELSFDKARDFLIPRPFLPTKLESILLEQMQIIKDEEEEEREYNKKISTFSSYDEEDDSVVVPVVQYVDSMEDGIGDDFGILEEDESIVSYASLNTGGILDSSELNKINDILREDIIQNEINLEKNDWKDINSIIDDALAEVKDYEFDLKQVPEIKPYHLVLSKFNINELRPLLEKFDQKVIDRISAGETVDIKISLKDK